MSHCRCRFSPERYLQNILVQLLELEKGVGFFRSITHNCNICPRHCMGSLRCATARCWQLARRGKGKDGLEVAVCARIGFSNCGSPNMLWNESSTISYPAISWITRFGPIWTQFSEAHLPMNGGTRRPCWACWFGGMEKVKEMSINKSSCSELSNLNFQT